MGHEFPVTDLWFWWIMSGRHGVIYSQDPLGCLEVSTTTIPLFSTMLTAGFMYYFALFLESQLGTICIHFLGGQELHFPTLFLVWLGRNSNIFFKYLLIWPKTNRKWTEKAKEQKPKNSTVKLTMVLCTTFINFHKLKTEVFSCDC